MNHSDDLIALSLPSSCTASMLQAVKQGLSWETRMSEYCKGVLASRQHQKQLPRSSDVCVGGSFGFQNRNLHETGMSWSLGFLPFGFQMLLAVQCDFTQTESCCLPEPKNAEVLRTVINHDSATNTTLFVICSIRPRSGDSPWGHCGHHQGAHMIHTTIQASVHLPSRHYY